MILKALGQHWHNLSDYDGTQTHNHLVRKQSLNH